MALRRDVPVRWVAHLSLLITFLLLITGGVRGSEAEEVAIEEVAAAGGRRGGGSGSGNREGEGVLVMEESKVLEGDVVVVENGTADAVVLDCPYDLDEKDMDGLHMAWYHPRYSNPVYQWILNRKPSVMEGMEDHVDLTYEASTDAFHRYRALKILNPTTEFAGRYRCQVNTYSADRTYMQDLIVFREPSTLNVGVEQREEEEVAVFCTVEEMYPQPNLHLYRKTLHSNDREILKGGTPVISFEGQSNTYSMEVENVVKEATLEGPTEFECHVTIPKTELRFTTTTKYQPRVSVTTGAVTTGSSTQQVSLVLLTVLSALVCLLRD